MKNLFFCALTIFALLPLASCKDESSSSINNAANPNGKIDPSVQVTVTFPIENIVQMSAFDYVILMRKISDSFSRNSHPQPLRFCSISYSSPLGTIETGVSGAGQVSCTVPEKTVSRTFLSKYIQENMSEHAGVKFEISTVGPVAGVVVTN